MCVSWAIHPLRSSRILESSFTFVSVFFFLLVFLNGKTRYVFLLFFLSPYWWLENQLLKYIFLVILVGLILLSCVIAALKAFHLSRCIGISFLTNTFLWFFFLYIFDLIIVREHEELRRRARTYPTTYWSFFCFVTLQGYYRSRDGTLYPHGNLRAKRFCVFIFECVFSRLIFCILACVQ